MYRKLQIYRIYFMFVQQVLFYINRAPTFHWQVRRYLYHALITPGLSVAALAIYFYIVRQERMYFVVVSEVKYGLFASMFGTKTACNHHKFSLDPTSLRAKLPQKQLNVDKGDTDKKKEEAHNNQAITSVRQANARKIDRFAKKIIKCTLKKREASTAAMWPLRKRFIPFVFCFFRYSAYGFFCGDSSRCISTFNEMIQLQRHGDAI